MEDSPAAAAGIKRRDVIVSFDGKPVVENDELPLMVAQTKVGNVVSVDVIRNGKKKSLDVTIERLNDDKNVVKKEEPVKNTTGAIVQDLTPDIAKSLGITGSSGVVVSAVQTGSAAERAGLSRGDVVLEVGGKEIKTADEFYQATKSFKKGELLLFLVHRNGGTVFMTLKDEE
jgi:serine protease Do